MFLSWAIKIHRSLYIAMSIQQSAPHFIPFHIMVCPRKLRVFQIFSTIHSIGIENSRSAKKASTSGWIALDFFFPFFSFSSDTPKYDHRTAQTPHSLSIRRVSCRHITHSMLFFFYKALDGWRRNFLMMVVIHSKKRFYTTRDCFESHWKLFFLELIISVCSQLKTCLAKKKKKKEKIQCSKRRRNHFDSRETFFAS